jgi:hypothetical protein
MVEKTEKVGCRMLNARGCWKAGLEHMPALKKKDEKTAPISAFDKRHFVLIVDKSQVEPGDDTHPNVIVTDQHNEQWDARTITGISKIYATRADKPHSNTTDNNRTIHFKDLACFCPKCLLDPNSKNCPYAKITGAWKPRKVKQILNQPAVAAAVNGDKGEVQCDVEEEVEWPEDGEEGEGEDDEEVGDQQNDGQQVIHIDGVQILPGLADLQDNGASEAAEFGLCVCGEGWTTDGDDRSFVECSDCGTWLHCECVQYEPEGKNEDEEWLCPRCAQPPV